MSTSPFASRSLLQHLGRGALGLALLAGTFHFALNAPLISLFLGIGAFFALRGCPLCWCLGLWETWQAHRQTKTLHCAPCAARQENQHNSPTSHNQKLS